MKVSTKRDNKRREVKNPRTREQNKARVSFKQKQYKMEQHLYKMEEELACSWAYAVVRPVSLKCTFVLRLDNLSNKVGYLRSSTSNV